MTDDLPIQPISAVEVASLLCTCGCCGHTFVIEYEALDQDTGSVDPEHDFAECPGCGTLFDAQAVHFGAHLIQRTGVGNAP